MVKANTLASKLTVAFVAVAMLFTVATPAQAQTVEELQAQITALMAQVAALSGGSSSASAACTFTGSLTLGAQGASVTCLQNYLISAGYSIPAGATGYFGAQTQSAVAAWQAANGVTPAVGYFGPVSQAKFASMTAGSGTGTGTGTGSTSDLEGGAGSITVDASSEFSSEEVGEDEEDAEVLAFNVEADGSDIEVTSIKVEFVQGTAADSEDLTDYADSVSVWFDGDKVGEADAEDFSESADVYTKSISLEDVIIREDEDMDLVVAVTGLNNLDSGDIDSDAWTVDVLNVRFVDGEGVTTTEDTDGDTLEKTFDFASFASSADIALKITKGDDAINDAHVIDIDDTDTTDDVEVLSFMMEAEGDSDITIKDLPVSIVSSADLNDTANTFHLLADGEEIGTESTPSTATTTTQVVFEDLDYVIDAGDEIEFVVTADIKSTASTLNDGDTIQAIFGETQTDNAAWSAEDEAGEELVDADVTGTVTGGTHTLYIAAFSFELVSADEALTAGDPGTSGSTDRGTFTIKYDLTAFGGDVSIDKSCVEAQADAADQGTEYTLENESGTETCTVTSTADTNASDADAWVVEEGQTETFTLTISATGADAFVRAYLTSINWDNDTTDTDPDLFFTSNLGEDETATDSLFLQTY